jgi:hypothetical protein
LTGKAATGPGKHDRDPIEASFREMIFRLSEKTMPKQSEAGHSLTSQRRPA